MGYLRLLVTTFALGGAAAIAWSCGTDAVGVEACREIESARCELAPGCGLDLGVPRHWGGESHDVTACQRFYRDACLHGLASSNDPGNVAVQDCVTAIKAGDCSVVRAPEKHPACAFLVPPQPPPPAADAAAEGGSDAASDATTP